MGKKKQGRCTNFVSCSIADEHRVVELQAAVDGFCPECGLALVPVGKHGSPGRRRAILAGAIVAPALIGIAAVVWAVLPGGDGGLLDDVAEREVELPDLVGERDVAFADTPAVQPPPAAQPEPQAQPPTSPAPVQPSPPPPPAATAEDVRVAAAVPEEEVRPRAPEPEPPVPATPNIPAGTRIMARIGGDVCSGDFSPGERVAAVVMEAVDGVGGARVPLGAQVLFEVQRPASGDAMLALAPRTLRILGAEHPLPASVDSLSLVERSPGGLNTGTRILIGAAIGGAAGHLAGGGDRRAIIGGVVVGGAAGGATALLRDGKHCVEGGSAVRLVLEAGLPME